MKKLLDDMKKAMMAEYMRAEKKYGATHASAPEAYAVMLEEYEEAAHEVEDAQFVLDSFWENVKKNIPDYDRAKRIEQHALNAAAECIQLAAMAYKTQLTYLGEAQSDDNKA